MNDSRLNVRQFARLLDKCAPGCHLNLYAAGGALIWLDDGWPDSPGSVDLASWRSGAGGHLWADNGKEVRLAWPVADEQERVSHYLLVETSRYRYEDLLDKIEPFLDTAAQTLASELYTNRQLDSMARELAVRYEELNLVYFTDDEVQHLDEGRQALYTLVQNCNDYLDVDTTALIMPDQGISIIRDHSRDCASDSGLATLLQNELIELLRCESRTMVLNEPGRAENLLGLSAKLIASPINDGNGHLAGALVIVRNAQSADFTNSDRNLLVVMSGKAAKIMQSSYDSLTGLMRQEGFERRLASALARARHADARHALLHLNIDRMHLVNDTLGYQAGDKVLRAVGSLLREQLRESDYIARLGGDEFGILVHNCSASQGQRVAEKLCKAIAALEVDCDERTVDVTACIGVAALDRHSESIISTQAGAEIACSVAKERGRNRWHLYDKEDPSLTARQVHMEWVERVKEALQNDRFLLYSQRIVPLRNTLPGYHFEILVRMSDGEGGLVSPGLFLPVAERYQMMPALDRWIFERTLCAIAEYAGVMEEQSIVCAINLSGQTLMDCEFVNFASEQFELTGVRPESICFEITETAAIANLKDARRLIHALRALGCHFALDDFGAGLSSFAYLRSLPVDYLKLDGSFVKPIATDETAAAMLSAMNQIGQIVGLRTVAEFVENDEIRARLQQMGVDYAQGYGVSRPRPLAEELGTIRAIAIPA